MLFDLLGARTHGSNVLDLFAGLGTVGLEALSHGARQAVFVERSRALCELLNENLGRTRCLDRAEVLCTTVTRALRMLEKRGETFGIVFVDPPYRENQAAGTVLRLTRGQLLAPDAVVVVEHTLRETIPDGGSLRLMWRRRLGYTILSGYCYDSPRDCRSSAGTTTPLLHHSTTARPHEDGGGEGGHQ